MLLIPNLSILLFISYLLSLSLFALSSFLLLAFSLSVIFFVSSSLFLFSSLSLFHLLKKLFFPCFASLLKIRAILDCLSVYYYCRYFPNICPGRKNSAQQIFLVQFFGCDAIWNIDQSLTLWMPMSESQVTDPEAILCTSLGPTHLTNQQ